MSKKTKAMLELDIENLTREVADRSIDLEHQEETVTVMVKRINNANTHWWIRLGMLLKIFPGV